ncbi:hypothetical protein AB0D78_45115 [Streptomyces avermitilis]|uniref:hypothetical protein n=1 Tax=Streptomyces avermitilis TaxID=33903 RepID=UPI00340F924E
MPALHARPTSNAFDPAPAGETPVAGPGSGRHRRKARIAGRLRLRIIACRDIEFLSSRTPGHAGGGEEYLLLVHVRKVVGRVDYHICTACTEAVITGVVIEERFHDTGLGARALAHLRFRHPGMAWRSTLRLPTPRDLKRRMRIPTDGEDGLCSHVRRALSAPAPVAA